MKAHMSFRPAHPHKNLILLLQMSPCRLQPSVVSVLCHLYRFSVCIMWYVTCVTVFTMCLYFHTFLTWGLFCWVKGSFAASQRVNPALLAPVGPLGPKWCTPRQPSSLYIIVNLTFPFYPIVLATTHYFDMFSLPGCVSDHETLSCNCHIQLTPFVR